MAIVITQARFAAKGPQGVAAKPQDGLDAAGRLVASIGGTLLASYRTSGDHDVLFIFEADSYDEAIRALGAAAAGSGLADLNTVRVLASRATKPAMSGAEGASAAKLAATFSQQWSSASVGADGHWEVLRNKWRRSAGNAIVATSLKPASTNFYPPRLSPDCTSGRGKPSKIEGSPPMAVVALN